MTSGVAVEALTLTLGAFRLGKIDFDLPASEILVILGPNGFGKSVTLETIAGFHRPDSGRVLIAGRDVTALPPERRNIGFVVQSFGLFPHLNVERNIAIGRRNGRPVVAGDKTLPPQGDIAALLKYFDIAHLARRIPHDLSAGEKQRVALARALASAPDLFLFDEPFSALDAQSHCQLRDELLSFLRALAIPAIFVTHDHTDAQTLADKIVVLRGGTMLQARPAPEIFQKPVSSAVAGFMGVENTLDGWIAEITDGIATIAVGTAVLRARAPSRWERQRQSDWAFEPSTLRFVRRIARDRRLAPAVWRAASSAYVFWDHWLLSRSTAAFCLMPTCSGHAHASLISVPGLPSL